LARTFAGMRRITALMFAILETAAMQKLTFIAQVLVPNMLTTRRSIGSPDLMRGKASISIAAALTRRGRAHHML